MARPLQEQLGNITELDSEGTGSIDLNGADLTNAGDGYFTNVFVNGQEVGTGGGGSATSLVYEVDYSSLTNQDLTTGGDGEKTIDGKTYYLQGSPTTAAVVNGTGLQFVDTATNQANGTYFALESSQFDGLDNGMVVWWEINASSDPSAWASFVGAYLGVADYNPDASWLAGLPMAGWSQANEVRGVEGLLSTSVDIWRTLTTPSSLLTFPKVLVCVFAHGVSSYYIGDVDGGGGWPDLSTLTYVGSRAQAGSGYALPVANYSVGPQFSMFQSSTASGTVTFTITKMRIFNVVSAASEGGGGSSLTSPTSEEDGYVAIASNGDLTYLAGDVDGYVLTWNASLGQWEASEPTSSGGVSESTIDGYLSNIDGYEDDWSPTGWDTATILRMETDGSGYYITGFAAPTESGVIRKTLINIDASQSITLNHQDTNSAATNRIITQGTDLVLGPNDIVHILYDTTTQRWRVY